LQRCEKVFSAIKTLTTGETVKVLMTLTNFHGRQVRFLEL